MTTLPTHNLASRGQVDPFIAMDMLAEARALEASGKSVIHLEVGQPGFSAPMVAREAATRAIEAEVLGYTEALGMASLRNAIAGHYDTVYGVDVPASRVVVTTGSSAGFVLAFLATLEPGAGVILPTPHYPAYRNVLKSLDLEPVILPLRAADGWLPTVEGIRAAVQSADKPVRALLLASPSNPAGTIVPQARLAEIAGECRRLGVELISDEIYHRLTYGMEAQTALAIDPEAIVVNSFSKYYCMTGWRIGWMVVPEDLVRPIERLAQNVYICPPAVSQVAAAAVFDATAELEEIREIYAANRRLLLDALPELGLGDFLPADGAFYIYTDIGHLTNDSAEFSRRMLRETGVATTPGLDFDPERGNRFLRLSFAGKTEDIEDAVSRLAGWLPRQ